MYESEFGTLYRLYVRDLSTGKRKAVETAPIRGRYPAQEKLDQIQRANRDPRLYYEIERTTPLRDPEDSRELHHEL